MTVSIFQNSHLVHCWETKECTRKQCPIIGEEGVRCWQVSGTYCGGSVQGQFVDKYHSCKECEVYKAACPTIVEELGEQLNNMLYLLRKQKEIARQHMDKIDYLNKDLLSSLENLDAKNRVFRYGFAE
ncbi:MAG: hypothetical protein KKE17_15200 [Proteobacteria bacterium]|nr:hypothetical protein [Pseudomonadota bacterium]MBU1711346.1 hypothetical protein [Pseudomonadota bacterium]